MTDPEDPAGRRFEDRAAPPVRAADQARLRRAHGRERRRGDAPPGRGEARPDPDGRRHAGPERLPAHPRHHPRPALRRRAGDHVHQQEPGNRQGLGHAPGRARLHRQAGRCRRADRARSRRSTRRHRTWPSKRSTARTAKPTGRAHAGRAHAGAGHSWLAVECGGQGLLFPLAQAGEIFSLVPLLPVPHTQAWFAGVANLRGGLHGVVDLAAFLGIKRTALPDAAREQPRLVALNPSLGLNCALLVDRLAGLRSADQLAAEPEAAEARGRPSPACAGATATAGRGRRSIFRARRRRAVLGHRRADRRQCSPNKGTT